jgi:hypothetical protein
MELLRFHARRSTDFRFRPARTPTPNTVALLRIRPIELVPAEARIVNSTGMLLPTQRATEHPEERKREVMFKVGLYTAGSEMHMLIWDISPFRFTKSSILIFS